MEYTKGEWRVIPLTQPGWRHLVASDESLIEVAKIYLRGKNPDVESLANAHLIAAAPDMHQSGTGLDIAIGEAIIKIAQATKLSNALIQIIQETVLPAQQNWRKAKAKAEGE